MIVQYHEDYYSRSDWENSFVPANRDYVSSEIYLRNSNKYKYNSFILGSSRTLAYKTQSWIKFLDKGAIPFVFDAQKESFFGIYSKVIYLDKVGSELENCLIIIDPDVTFDFDSEHSGHLYLKHPSIAGTSWTNFYSEFIKSYFDPGFLWSYYKQLIVKDTVSIGHENILWSKYKFDNVTNEMETAWVDEKINSDPKGYYEKINRIFYSLDTVKKDLNPKINDTHVEMFKKMKAVFDKHNTNYKFVISPLYNQVKFNDIDVKILTDVFGKDNVFDFSGKNRFTSSKENFYESSHYRTFIGDSIISIIYNK